ncbi:MAG: aminoacyl-histidine dipeptidase [Clostridia bacterium]|nr:aminoacyl-histidine dipeptidase [Clostridia bacterium]
MGNILAGLEPGKVFEFFELLSSVPHGSGNTGPISDICVRFAKERGLECFKDEVNNVIIRKLATPGFENAPTVILQGHLDMVCTKRPDCDIYMEKEGPRLATDGEWVWAEGSSMGGDDAIGVAAAMAVLDDDKLVHPPLEALFTVDEETSLVGAGKVDVSLLKGKMLVNLDSEEEGVFTVSCAGGMRCDCTVPVKREEVPEYVCYRVEVSGLQGGHSGAEIHKGRGNANKLLARFLYSALTRMDLRLDEIIGGDFDNVIPKTAKAVVYVEPEKTDVFEAMAEDFSETVRKELASTDGGFRLAAELISGDSIPADSESTEHAVTAIYATPNGIQRMSPDIKDFVQTSLNLGIMRTSANFISFSYSIRSSVYSEKFETFSRVEAIVAACGGNSAVRGEYPAWAYRADSPLRDICLEAYRRVYGGEARVEGIHAGLECGVFADRIEGLDAISFGPDLRDIHSVRERLNVKSTERMYDMICEILRIAAGV